MLWDSMCAVVQVQLFRCNSLLPAQDLLLLFSLALCWPLCSTVNSSPNTIRANLQSSSHVVVHRTPQKPPGQLTGSWYVSIAWQNIVQQVSSMVKQPGVPLEVGHGSRWEISMLPWTAEQVPVLWHFCMAQGELDSLLSFSSLRAVGP